MLWEHTTQNSLWESSKSSTNYTATFTPSLTPKCVHLPASLVTCSCVCLQTWHLLLVAIMPDELGNLLYDCRRGCIPAWPHSSCSDWRPYSVCLTLTTLTIKSAGPFYNFQFHYPLFVISNQPLVLVKPPVWTSCERTYGLMGLALVLSLYDCCPLTPSYTHDHARPTALRSVSDWHFAWWIIYPALCR